MEKESIAIVLITFNRLDMLKDLVEAIKNQTLRADEIFVINNSSTDGTTEWI